VNVPKFAELAASKLYTMAMSNKEIRQYLPEPSQENPHPVNREFLYNIINTLDEEFFHRNIPEAYRLRREHEMERKQ
jgi:hypothetical protein